MAVRCMSALGHKRRFRTAIVMSALPRKRTFRGAIGISRLVEFGKARVAILNAQFMVLAARLALRRLRGDHQ
jgi:hypothetical protein